MKTQFMKFTLAASIGLALAFTFSCSDGDGNENEQPSSSSGTEVSSSSNGGSGGSSSSNGAGGSSSSNGGGDGGKLNYEGKTYKTVLIGTQRWMAENLNYAVDGSKCYDNQESYCDKYGRLYDWSTANTVCPSGWHLPTGDEWNTLAAYVESANICSACAGKHLKATSGWNSYAGIVNLDTYGFLALPGGSGGGSNFYDAGNVGTWWSASEDGSDDAYLRGMHYDGEYVGWGIDAKSVLFSVRCVKD